MPLTVTIYPDLVTAAGEDTEGDPIELDPVDYICFVSDGTYGPPPLIAPKDGQRPLARPGQRVLYLNPRAVPLFEITRTED